MATDIEGISRVVDAMTPQGVGPDSSALETAASRASGDQ
jgi:hypothetical protein